MQSKANFSIKQTINESIADEVKANSRYDDVLLIEDIINGMLDWVRVIDLDGNIIYINKAMEEGLKHPAIGKKCYEAFGRIEPCENCVSHRSIFDGKSHEKEETFGDKYFSVKSSPIKCKDGQVIAVVEVLRDVTNEKRLQQKLINKNKELRDDINMAKKIQMSFLPSNLPGHKVKFSYIYNPCYELGGDFLDVFMVDEDHLGLYVADVAGHGITASLLTVFLSSSFNKTILSPSAALTDLYNEFNLVGLDSNLYITVFYSIINLKNNVVTYSNAGHNTCPIVFSNTKFEILRSAGLPICNWIKEPNYTEKTYELSKGDRVFFCTDGIIEARNNQDEQFGEERLLKLLMTKKDEPDVILNNIINKASIFIEKDGISTFTDDITMALLETI